MAKETSEAIDWTCVSDEGFIGHPNAHFPCTEFSIVAEKTWKCINKRESGGKKVSDGLIDHQVGTSE